MTTTPAVRVYLAALSGALILFPAPSHAQPVPGKQTRMILTYPPGCASDIMGRIIAQKLGDYTNAEIDRWGKLIREAGIRTD